MTIKMGRAAWERMRETQKESLTKSIGEQVIIDLSMPDDAMRREKKSNRDQVQIGDTIMEVEPYVDSQHRHAAVDRHWLHAAQDLVNSGRWMIVEPKTEEAK